jgi:hypothetical protein
MAKSVVMRWLREDSNRKPQRWNVERWDEVQDNFKVVAWCLTEGEAWARIRHGRTRSLIMTGWTGSGSGKS